MNNLLLLFCSNIPWAIWRGAERGIEMALWWVILYIVFTNFAHFRYGAAHAQAGAQSGQSSFKRIDPLHKWSPNLNNNTHTSIASHSCENSFVLKHESEAKDVPSIVIQI